MDVCYSDDNLCAGLHCCSVGYPVVTMGFSIKSCISYRFRLVSTVYCVVGTLCPRNGNNITVITNCDNTHCLEYCHYQWLWMAHSSSVAASIVHSKLDYCNSLYYNLPKSQISHLQQIQNCLACTVVKAPKPSHITPILRSLHWLKINECIEYKLLSLTYRVLTTSQPDYLHNLISVQSTGRTRSSPAVTLARPSVSSSLQITVHSFRCASPYTWN